MAEIALGALGAAVAGVQTAEGLQKLAGMFEHIKQAAENIEYFHLETQNFVRAFDAFHNVATNSIQHLDKKVRDNRVNMVASTIELFESTRKSLVAIAQNFDLGDYNIGLRIWRVIVRTRWYLKRDSIAFLHLQMERVKSSATLFMTITMCEDLRRRVYELENAQKEVPKDMKGTLKYYTDRVKVEYGAAKIAASAMTSFHRTHRDVASLPVAVENQFRVVEKAIRKEAAVVVPISCQRSNRGSKSRNAMTLSSHEVPVEARSFAVPRNRESSNTKTKTAPPSAERGAEIHSSAQLGDRSPRLYAISRHEERGSGIHHILASQESLKSVTDEDISRSRFRGTGHRPRPPRLPSPRPSPSSPLKRSPLKKETEPPLSSPSFLRPELASLTGSKIADNGRKSLVRNGHEASDPRASERSTSPLPTGSVHENASSVSRTEESSTDPEHRETQDKARRTHRGTLSSSAGEQVQQEFEPKNDVKKSSTEDESKRWRALPPFTEEDRQQRRRRKPDKEL